MRSIHSIAFLLVSAALLLVGCSAPEAEDPAGEKRFSARIVLDTGGLGDRSFNDAAHRGLTRAIDELEIDGDYFEPGESADRDSGLNRYAAEAHDLIFGVGFVFTDDLLRLAKQNPDLHFACIDMSVKFDDEGNPLPLPDNLAGLSFREEQGSFLVGAIAALESETGKVGFIGGMNVPLIRKFEAGFAAGARNVRPDCEVVVAYVGETHAAFRDASKGKSIALGMYNQGVDVIFHAAGQTGRGLFEAAREKGKLAIGVDSDQYAEAPGHVLTSMIKRVDVAVFETIARAAEGEFQSGMQVFGLEENGVGYVLDDNNRDLIAPETVERVEQLKEAILAGRLTVPTEPK